MCSKNKHKVSKHLLSTVSVKCGFLFLRKKECRLIVNFLPENWTLCLEKSNFYNILHGIWNFYGHHLKAETILFIIDSFIYWKHNWLKNKLSNISWIQQILLRVIQFRMKNYHCKINISIKNWRFQWQRGCSYAGKQTMWLCSFYKRR